MAGDEDPKELAAEVVASVAKRLRLTAQQRLMLPSIVAEEVERLADLDDDDPPKGA